MDASGEGDGRHAERPPPGQHGDGLAGMAHDEGRLVVAFGLLVEFFDSGHFLARLGVLQAVAYQNGPAPAAQQHRMVSHDQVRPDACQQLHVQRGRVEEVEQAVVTHRLDPHRADDAGDAEQVVAHAKARQYDDHPEKRSFA